MKTNPVYYKDLLGKKFINAYLFMTDDNGNRVKNIKDATLKIIRNQITKIEIIERKNDWQEIAYVDNPAQFLIDNIVVFRKGELRGFIESYANTTPEYTYYDNQDDYYIGNMATYVTFDNGQTDEEIREILENTVKAEFEEEIESIERTIAHLEEKKEILMKMFAK